MSAESAPPAADKTLQYTMISVACVASALALAGFALGGGASALGVAIGGLIALANLAVFSRVVRGLLGLGRHRRVWALVGIIKVLVLFGGVWWLLRSQLVSGLTMVIGYGAMPLGIAIGGFLAPKPTDPNSSDAPGGDAAGQGLGSSNGAGRPESDPDSSPSDAPRPSDAE